MDDRITQQLMMALRAVTDNSREFEEVDRLAFGKEAYEGVVNADVEIE